MSASRSRALGLLLLAAIPLACRDGSGPHDRDAASVLVLRTLTGQQSLWDYAGTSGRRVTADTVRFIFTAARAEDGRIAYVMVNPPEWENYRLVELAPNGTVLRSVALPQPAAPASAPPTDLAYSPDGRRLAWRSKYTDVDLGIAFDSLFVLDPGATARRGIAARTAYVYPAGYPNEAMAAPALRWMPNGRLVFGPPGVLLALDITGLDTLPLATGLGHVRDYDLTFDGRVAVVTRQPDATSARIVTQSIFGGVLRHVFNSTALDPVAIRWAPDGRHVATTGVDSVPDAAGAWRRYAAPRLVDLEAPGTPARMDGVAVAAFHGWTRDGRLVMTGGAPGAWYQPRDVYVGTFGAAAVNVTSTTEADETLAMPRR